VKEIPPPPLKQKKPFNACPSQRKGSLPKQQFSRAFAAKFKGKKHDFFPGNFDEKYQIFGGFPRLSLMISQLLEEH